MSKISREDNKKRFKTGMYPTQQDFENVFDSYVHKDDTIDPSKIVSGDENIVDIINRKAEEKHSHEIGDVKNLSETLQQIQDDLDTAEDNIAGHETRIVTLEAAKTDYEAFKERVRAFLEDANASDTTIDRWHEIENFLQGITDTETLTGLLNDLKQEILSEIPEPQPQPSGNYLELVDDLDAYTDAPDGKIVKYVGQTNEKYTRGFDYERVAGEGLTIHQGEVYLASINGNNNVSYKFPFLYNGMRTLYPTTNYTCVLFTDTPQVGDVFIEANSGVVHTISKINSSNWCFAEDGDAYFKNTDIQPFNVAIYANVDGIEICPNLACGQIEDAGAITSGIDITNKVGYGINTIFNFIKAEEESIIPSSTWQPIPSFNVIN